MITARQAAWAVAVTVIATILASGPLVPWIAFADSIAPGAGTLCSASGTADVTVSDASLDTFDLRKANYGSEVYVLAGDPVRLQFADVTGCLRVGLQVKIPALNIEAQTLTFVESSGRISLSPTQIKFAPATIDQQAYDATIAIIVDGKQKRILIEKNTTLQVNR